MDRRTQTQREFDLAKHGWSFSNRRMLSGKVTDCTILASSLAHDDPRRRELEHMREALADLPPDDAPPPTRRLRPRGGDDSRRGRAAGRERVS